MADTKSQKGSTNGLAIAALIMGIVPGLGLLGVIFGFVALSQLKKQGGEGKGFAIAGIILGFAQIVFGVLYFVFVFWLFNTAVNVIESPLYNNEVQNALNDLNNIQFNFQ